MKKICVIISALLVLSGLCLGLAGCGDKEAAVGSGAIFQLEDYPRVDGSTANLPMMSHIMAKTCGISEEQAERLTSCRKTSGAWLALANGEADLLLVYEASEGTKRELAEIGTELDITPIGRDALVFIVNEANPVQSLSREQLVDIYTGKITNWSEVGGADMPIVAFQRPEASGSQSLFMKLLMQDTAPMDPPKEFRPSEMGDLIEELASYNNSADALGYSVFYYASYMYTQPGLRFVAVDGVIPSDETIADGSYPLLNEYYLAVRAEDLQNNEDNGSKRLREWILADEGQTAIREAGYIPLD